MLTPMALLERLARLVPMPGRHMIRFHGVLAPAAPWRERIVPMPRDAPSCLLRRAGSRRLDWANLLRRVFMLEVLACGCGGTRRVIAAIEEGPTARKILRHLCLPYEPPRLEPARLDQHELWPTGPPGAPCDPLPEDDFDQRTPHDHA